MYQIRIAMIGRPMKRSIVVLNLIVSFLDSFQLPSAVQFPTQKEDLLPSLLKSQDPVLSSCNAAEYCYIWIH